MIIYTVQKMIFIDTGSLIARYIVNDQYHKNAMKKWERIEKKKYKMCTSNFVLNETFTLLGRWVGYEFAAEKANLIYKTKVFQIYRPDEEEDIASLNIFRKYADQKISFTDCVSFMLMKKYKVKSAFTFDKHFHIAGFELF